MYDGLLSVEEQIGLRSVGVAVAGALQEAQRDQRVEEVAGRALVQAEPADDGVERFRGRAPAR